MTITVTQRTESQAALAATITSASFTPTANSKLYVWCFAQNNNATFQKHWSISNTGSLTFRTIVAPPDRTWNGNTAFASQGYLWVADVGGSPSSMTVTVDADTSSGNTFNYGIEIFDVTPNTATLVQYGYQSDVDAGGNSETIAVAMRTAITSGSTAICCIGAGNDGVATFTLPTDFGTSLANQSAINAKVAAAYGTAVTASTVTCSDLGTTIGNSAMVVLELSETIPALSELPMFVEADVTSFSASRSPSISFSTPPLENDLIIIWPSSTTTAAVTMPAGVVNVLGGTTDVESDAHEIACAYHFVTAAESASTTTFTFTNFYDTTQTGNIVAALVRGVDLVNPINITGTGFNSANTAADHTLPGLTPTCTDGIWFSCIAKDGTGAYATDPSGWDRVGASNTNQGKWGGYRIARTTAGSAISGQDITESAGDEWAAISVVVQAKRPPNDRVVVKPSVAVHRSYSW